MNFTKDQVLRLIEHEYKGMTQAQTAYSMGISPQYLNNVMQGRALPSDKVLSELGLEKVLIYRKKK